MTDWPRLKFVSIGGVDVSSYVAKFKIEKKFEDDIGTIDIYLNRAVLNVLDITDKNIGDAIIVQRGARVGTEETIFKGEVTVVSPAGSLFIIEGNDRMYEARRRNVTKSFDKNIDAEAGKISEIFKTLINDYTSMTADDDSVQDSGDGFILTKFICNNADVYERCTELAKTLNWQFYYNPLDDKVYFEPKGFTNTGVTLTVGVEIPEVPKWIYNSTEMANSVKIIGAEQEVGTTEYANGDGSTVEFRLTYTPETMKVYVDGNLKVGGKEGSTSGTYDYTFDSDRKLVTFVAGRAPGAGTNNITFDYTYMLPAPVIGKNYASINKYGYYEKVLFKDELKTIADARSFMTSYLAKYSEPFINTKLKVVSATNFHPGEKIMIVDNINNISKLLLVLSVTHEYPYKNDVIEVGDKIQRISDWLVGVHDRVRRLEEKAGKSTDLLLHVIDLSHETIRTERRYLELQKRFAGGFVLGSARHGVLGVSPLGDMSTDYVVVRHVTGAQGYCEYLYDVDRINTSVTTATIDTVNWEVT